MHRCLELAKLGSGHVSPNPMVGAVLVYNDKIIGEGYHQQYGEAHAEVNCLNSVTEENKKFISQSALYVSLEPCTHFGKTPPCTDLILHHKIHKVIIGCIDPFVSVNGKGADKLKEAGAEVETGMLEKECKEINKRFFTFQTLFRPYIILKWAETADGRISANGKDRLFISNENTNRLVHKWRSEEASILIGTNTALLDDPELTTRYWAGSSPIRMVLDMELRLPQQLKIFNDGKRTIIFNSKKQSDEGELFFYKLNRDESIVKQILNALYKLNIQSVLVEGGRKLLQAFIDEGLYDEIRRISNRKLTIDDGLAAPVFSSNSFFKEIKIQDDLVSIYLNDVIH
jgi:diaminohydroxyphosphoribosylaminopyrimidine deaminase/5-amino-6-(5-phosphoribosylamino)uracil reductase